MMIQLKQFQREHGNKAILYRLLGRFNSSVSVADKKSTAASRPSPIPLIENYRPRWPQPAFDTTEVADIVIPKRTIPDEVLKFQLKSTMDPGHAIYYPHLAYNPVDFKVILFVSIDNLGLSDEEKRIFIAMIGPRFNGGSREARLVCEMFPNRIENKRYLIYQLETLVAESKKILKDYKNPPVNEES